MTTTTGPNPVRVQRKRTKGSRLPPGAVYVGRPSKWGSPFRVGEPVPRESPLFDIVASHVPGQGRGLASITMLTPYLVVDAYFEWLVNQPALWLAVPRELRGLDLACYCPVGQPCHADLLLALANDEEPEVHQ